MKYSVVWAWEMDGHAGASGMVCNSAMAVQKYIKQVLLEDSDDPNKPLGKITSKRDLDDGGSEYFGEWECGEFSITVHPFKTFTNMCNKELFTRTG